jgi:hypothetical protein
MLQPCYRPALAHDSQKPSASKFEALMRSKPPARQFFRPPPVAPPFNELTAAHHPRRERQVGEAYRPLLRAPTLRPSRPRRP